MAAENRNSEARRNGHCMVTADKCVSLATDTHAAIEELFESVFSMRFVPRLCSESHREELVENVRESPASKDRSR
jgi:hypothetical protein